MNLGCLGERDVQKAGGACGRLGGGISEPPSRKVAWGRLRRWGDRHCQTWDPEQEAEGCRQGLEGRERGGLNNQGAA